MTRIAYAGGRRPTALEVVEGRDLSGKTAIVTGATSGLGVETARALASAGADVALAVRDMARGEAVAQEIRQGGAKGAVSVIPLELADPASVRACAAAFQGEAAAPRPLHILINNAAIMATPKTLTPQGYEAQFATNHLGHFLLAELLTPNLTAEGARVVALSSTGHLRSPVVFDDIHFERRDYDPWLAYGQSKTADALFAVELSRRLADKGVTANAVHPGGIMTGLQKHMDPADIKARGWVDEAGKVNPAFKTVEQGAATSVWAATAPELEGVGGKYLEDCQEAEPWRAELPYAGYAPYALDPEAAARLWTMSRAMVGLG
jgi:NAD(P)-dependent dehydrogenase (short-subunit alcohol dehydrogenase family)